MQLKLIPGFLDRYSASDEGNIYSHVQDRWLASNNISTSGYRVVGLVKDGKGYGFQISRLIATTYLGLDLFNLSMTVDHIDGCKTNDKLTNLRILSLHDNILAFHGKLGIDTEAHKLCSKCKVLKLRSEFSKSVRYKDSLQCWCKSCNSIAHKCRTAICGLNHKESSNG